MGLEGFVMTEEKVKKLLPVVEQILSRMYGRDLDLKDLTIGGVTVVKDKYKNDKSNSN